MIVVDLEMSGLYPERCGIFEIGAVDLETKETFFGNCHIDDDEELVQGGDKTVEEVTGRTEEDMRSKDEQSQKELLEDFFSWINERKVKTIICQNFSDTNFLEQKARKHGLEIPFGWRSFDLHTLAHIKYFEIKGSFDIKNRQSDFGLGKTLEFVGMKDERDVHNALEDAKLEAEVFSRLVYGKGVLEEFKKFEIPLYLKK